MRLGRTGPFLRLARRRGAVAPGPTGKALFGNFDVLRSADPLLKLTQLANEYGDVVRLRIGQAVANVEVYLLRNPDHVRHVLQDNRPNYPKSFHYNVLRPLAGDGLLTSEGEVWLRQRRLVGPTFHRSHVNSFAPIATEACATMLDRWDRHPTGQVVELSSEMAALALTIIGRALFSTDLTGEARSIGDALTIALEEVYRRTLAVPAMVAPRAVDTLTRHGRRYRRALATLDGLVAQLITERRHASQSRGDLLDLLLSARDADDGQGMSDTQVRDEVMTLLLAGHETTANALTWAWYLLSTHPEARRRLVAEVNDVLGERTPTANDLASLPVTRAVVCETLRLYPSVPGLQREVLDDDEVGGYRLPAGSIVSISPYVVHRNPALWRGPEAFDIERFMPGAPEPHRFAYLPFGGGQRRCIGDGFAMMEAILVLALMARRVELDLVPGHRVEPSLSITLRPRFGMPMLLADRDRLRRTEFPMSEGR